MAKATTRARQSRGKASKSKLGYSLGERALSEATGLVFVLLALLSVLALYTYDASDPVLQWAPVSNRAGLLGANLSAFLFRSMGVGSGVLVAGVGVLGVRLLIGKGIPGITSRFWLGSGFLLVSVATLPIVVDQIFPGTIASSQSGALGAFLASFEIALLSDWGSLLINVFFLLFGALAVFGISSATAASGVSSATLAFFRGTVAVVTTSVTLVVGLIMGSIDALRRGVRAVLVWQERRARLARVAKARERESQSHYDGKDEAEPGWVKQKPGSSTPDIVDHSAERGAGAQPKQEAFAFSDRRAGIDYELPDTDIFQHPPASTHSLDRDSLIMRSRIVEKKLRDFGVNGRVVTVHPGPVITMYEFEPAPGVKVNKIVGLSDDLALALRALSIRIVAPIPGKSVVGIEVPNSDRDIVYIREGLDSDVFRESNAPLGVVMGKDIFGGAVSADLSRMPHLLVAGATGTGKSVFLNTLICSLLCRMTPDELKLLLVDPKLLELSVYENIPHLIAEVVTNPKRAAAALHGVVGKMEERYQRMAALGVRNIKQYNERIEQELEAGNTTFRLKPKPGQEEGEEVEFEKIPYIVVVIDELADLMVVSARDVEEALQRLAQMSRAAGIHLVLATQRPSVDVLTGVIKANFPSRVAFQVSSRTDSRTILDQNGADQLLGQGDMLFLPPGTSKIQRIHGAYTSEKEVNELVEFLVNQGDPEYDEDIMNAKTASEERVEISEDDVDELYDQAVAIVADSRNASISYVQRRLKVGYNRAARMIEQMEAEGVIGPQVGSKSREVFIHDHGLE